MKDLTAPISAFVATLAVVGRLFLFGQSTSYGGFGTGYGTMFEYLFLDYDTLDPGVGIQALFASAVLWIAVFSTLWLVLSLFESFIRAVSRRGRSQGADQGAR